METPSPLKTKRPENHIQTRMESEGNIHEVVASLQKCAQHSAANLIEFDESR